ncbi:MAG: adenosyl-hopene transferase HpnH [Deltaproteobacteria bacterium]|nr:adenosyl-hopene transferase HpnH [Deltaproteobacteria bacterium]
MAVPLSQGLKVFNYVMKQKIRGVKRYPLVLMLEPLFRCNLECKGCGKIQFPEETLQKRLSVKECLEAAEECGAPMVSIPGGEPLIHPEIKEIVEGLIKQKRYIYLCTNAILLERKLHLFKPSKYLTFSIHLDGLKEDHDKAVSREGVFEVAVKAIKAAHAKGFRVTTNTTLFEGVDPQNVRKFFDFAMSLGVEGMMVSPGYSYEKAPDQEHFLRREKSQSFFREIFSNRKKEWKFNQSPFFLDFLMGEKNYQCTPWGNPTRNIFGWQKPCYLLGEGYAKTFKEMMETTEWENYGTGKNPKCADCMVHGGYEPTAVIDTFSSIKNLLHAAKASV